MKFWIALLVSLSLFLAVNGADDTCPVIKGRESIPVGSSVCCNPLIKTVVETAMSSLDLFTGSGPAKALAVIVQAIQKVLQKTFKTSFEIIMSEKDFQLNTHYNGTAICKFESRNYILAIYETPVKYDINSPREEYFSSFALGDTLKLSDISSVANTQTISKIQNAAPTGLGGFFG